MLSYPKRAIFLKTQAVEKDYSAFALLEKYDEADTFVFDEAENCDLASGIRMGVGVEIYQLESGYPVLYDWGLGDPKQFLYAGDTFAFLSFDGNLYFYNEKTRTFTLAYSFDGETAAVEAQDEEGEYHLYFCGASGVYRYNNGGFVRVLESACAPVACAFAGRIFTASADELVYSAPFATGEFTESLDGGGRVVLPAQTGEIVALTATAQALFVFCRFGIWKLTAAGSAREFRLERVAYSGKEIYKNSACACAAPSGEKVYFFSEDGLWRLDKSGVKRIVCHLQEEVKRSGQVFEHACFGGRVFYAYKARDNGIYGLVIDGETDEWYHSFTIEGVSCLRGKIVGVIDGVAYELKAQAALPTHRLAQVVAENVGFGLDGKKTLDSLRLCGEGTVTLFVGNGKREKSYTLALRSDGVLAKIGLCGEKFRVAIQLAYGARVWKIGARLKKLAKEK
ncbi:MAG: hypothetical protein IJW60_01760 [Clostridia bacterium]|nr:hypothetical protein [Clostridia bacterium]